MIFLLFVEQLISNEYIKFRYIDSLLPNFSVRKPLTPEASASLNMEVRTFNSGANTSNPISFRSGSFGKSKWYRV